MTTNRNEIITAPSEPISGLESNSEYVFISSLSNLYNYTIIICHASCVPGHFLTIQEIRRLRPDHPMVMLRPSGGQVCHPAADSDPDETRDAAVIHFTLFLVTLHTYVIFRNIIPSM